MRKVRSVILVTIFSVTLASFVSAQSYDLTVEGQNNPEKDIKAVQEAVEKGGDILLKGAFDFGIKGQVKNKK